MKVRLFFAALMVVTTAGFAQGQGLLVDFNSTTQDGGPHNLAGFEPYDAGHEVAADFNTKSYSAFATTVTVTPDWPNTTDNRVRQMIDRGAANDATWTDASTIDGVTDWLGIDTRTGNGGNGDWDGTTGTPTYMTLALGGLPAGTYNWLSHHQDTENVHTNFQVELSTDGGATYAKLADGYMSDGTVDGNPDSLLDGGQANLVTNFAEMAAAGSVYTTSFVADGTSDVVLQFAPYSGALGAAVHNQLWGINGLQLAANAPITWDAVVSGTTAADLIGGPEIPFVTATYPGGNADGTFFTGDGGDTGNADLNTIYNSHGWNGAGATITTGGLNAGEDYQIQLLAAGDTRGCCDTRNQAGDDGAGNTSGDFERGNNSVVGSFTATGSTQAINIISGTVNGVDPGLSGYILADGDGNLVEALSFGFAADAAGMPSATVTVPEPASCVLFGLGGLLMLGLRRRS